MALIPFISFITSFIGVLGFACWDNDLEIPILYPFGKWLGEWWFHDYGPYGKIHFSDFPDDKPPMVGAVNTGNTIPFPYPYNMQSITTNFTYDDTQKTKKGQYTPVNNLYGITNVKPTLPTPGTVYVPNAVEMPDYIAKRLLGSQATWTELVHMSEDGKVYNTDVFKDGTPFVAAQIGPGKDDDDKWLRNTYESIVPGSQFQPPLTTALGGGQYTLPARLGTVSQMDYSGFEYSGSDADYDSKEAKNCRPFRPGRYKTDSQGNRIDSQLISAYPDNFSSMYGNDPYSTWDVELVSIPSFYDPEYDGATWVDQNGNSFRYKSWGDSNAAATSGENAPKNQQVDYISEMLTQEDPISKLDAGIIASRK